MTIRSMLSPKSSGVWGVSVMMCAAVAAVLLPCHAHAALGEPEASAVSDSQRFEASIRSIQRTSYRVHEMQLPSGTVLREFADAQGNVFAVAWKGPALPDLRQALGRYFDRYTGAQRIKRFSRGHGEIRESGFVMQSSGHMRAFSGRAYLPQNIPVGTSLDELR